MILIVATSKQALSACQHMCLYFAIRLKLFLEQFFIKCCVLNSELPHNSRYRVRVCVSTYCVHCLDCYRCHVVEEFNRGIYDYIIATDEPVMLSPSQLPGDKGNRKITGQKRKRDKEYGVARGIDFQGKCVCCHTGCVIDVCVLLQELRMW